MTSCGGTFACPDCGDVKHLRESVVLSAAHDPVSRGMGVTWRSCGDCALRLVSAGRARLAPTVE